MTKKDTKKLLKKLKFYLKTIQPTQVRLGRVTVDLIIMILECNSFKALLLNALGKEKEAMAMMKVTIFKNMTNATCWHIYGLIHRKAK